MSTEQIKAKVRNILSSSVGMIGRDTALKLLDALEAAEAERDEFRESFNSNESEKQTLFHQKDMLLTANINIGKNLKQAERERDELRESLAVMDGHLSASRALKQLWKNRAWDAEEEIARRDAAAGEPVGLVIADVFGDGDRYLKVKPINTKGLFIGCNLLYTVAPPAVLPPDKPVNTDLSRTDIMKNIAYNQALNDVKALGAQPQKPVVIPDLPHDCDRTEAHFKYIAALDAANVPYEIKK